jgi:predicted alpha/beta superfamily hydrolase
MSRGRSARAAFETIRRRTIRHGSCRGAHDYLAFVERELIPYIEARYRADPQRRALGGHSLGGLFGAYALLTKPELFQHYILSSPSLWFHENVTWNL